GVKPIKLQVTTEYGCVNEYTTTVTIDPDITVFIPNAFYPESTIDGVTTPCPNGDAECNTTFKPAAKGYLSIEIFVFNRWGQQVFHTTDGTKGWNGYIDNNTSGIKCQQDVYIYQINATSYSNKTYKYSGSVTLLR
ncbi:MAG: gliding motility-associated C-terminal domain-containing protein, partial [Bacteroidota bacterium]